MNTNSSIAFQDNASRSTGCETIARVILECKARLRVALGVHRVWRALEGWKLTLIVKRLLSESCWNLVISELPQAYDRSGRVARGPLASGGGGVEGTVG